MKTSRHCLGSYSPRQLARDLVALLEQDMHYIGWFASVARTYPADAPTMDWPHAMEVARAARLPLQVAEDLLTRSSHGPIVKGPQDHRSGLVPAGAISQPHTQPRTHWNAASEAPAEPPSSPQGSATIPANARRAGSAQTVRVNSVAQVSRPRTCV